MNEVLTIDSLLRSISFILVLFSIDTLWRCKRKPWMAIAGLALIALYYVQGMFTRYYSPAYVDVGLVLMNVNLILIYRNTEDPVIEWLRHALNTEVKNQNSGVTADDADRILRAFEEHVKERHYA